MKRNSCFKAVAGLFALTLVLTNSSCSLFRSEQRKTEPDNSESEVITDDNDFHSYNAEEIGSPLELDTVKSIQKLGNTDKVLITGTYGKSDTKIYLTDLTFNTYDELKLDTGASDNASCYYCAGVSPDGNIVVAATVIDYGDFEMPDFSDPDFDSENFNYDAMLEAAELSFKLITLDPNGKQLSSKDISGLEEYDTDDDPNTYAAIYEVFPCDSSTLIVSISHETGTTYALMGTDGSIVRSLDFGSDTFLNSLCINNSGEFAFSTWNDDIAVIKTIDPLTYQLTRTDIPVNIGLSNYLTSISAGHGDYDYYALCSKNLLGIKKNGEPETLINWTDSDLNGDGISAMLALDNDEFIIYENTYSTGTGKFFRLTPRDASELENLTILNLAMIYEDTTVKDKVSAFNKNNESYRIRITDYSGYTQYNDDSKLINTPVKQLKADLADGKPIDMVCFSDTSVFYGMSSSDTFADLYDYLGTDDTVSKDDLMPSMLKACEENGKLQFITPSFGFHTYAVKTEFWDKENWTLDDVIKAYDKLPANSWLFQSSHTKSDIFYILFENMNIIDWSKNSCSFDSPEFIKLLEFCNKFPETETKDDFVYTEATEEEREEYYKTHDGAIRSGRALMDYLDLSSLRNYNHAKYAGFMDDITLAGYPSPNGNGAAIIPNNGFGIIESSENKDECWKFISGFFTEDYQKNSVMWGIPSRISAFDKMLEEACNDPVRMYENGNALPASDVEYVNGENVTIPNLNDDEKNVLRSYIMNAGTNFTAPYDSEITETILEETEAYFTGKTTAEQTAKSLQAKITDLINE